MKITIKNLHVTFTTPPEASKRSCENSAAAIAPFQKVDFPDMWEKFRASEEDFKTALQGITPSSAAVPKAPHGSPVLEPLPSHPLPSDEQLNAWQSLRNRWAFRGPRTSAMLDLLFRLDPAGTLAQLQRLTQTTTAGPTAARSEFPSSPDAAANPPA